MMVTVKEHGEGQSDWSQVDEGAEGELGAERHQGPRGGIVRTFPLIPREVGSMREQRSDMASHSDNNYRCWYY